MSSLQQKVKAALERRIKGYEQTDRDAKAGMKKPGSLNPRKGKSVKGPK